MMQTIKPSIILAATLFFSNVSLAEKVELPPGMGGVPDIGAIPCRVFSEMLVIGPLGTRHSLLTWANGYYYARNGKALDELVAAAKESGEDWDFARLTEHFVAYCADNPQAITRAAVASLGEVLLKPKQNSD